MHVLVATAGKIDQQDLVRGQRWRQFRCVGQGMAGFEGRDDALEMTQIMESLQGFVCLLYTSDAADE